MSSQLLNFQYPTELVTYHSPLFSPPSFPPPNDWVISIDSYGENLSRFGENYWDFSSFQKGACFNFAKRKISETNILIVKKALFLTLYHPSLFPGQILSAKYCFYCLIRIAEVCDKNKISMAELSRFPRLHGEIVEVLKGASFKSNVNYLHRLRLHGAPFGLLILDQRALANIALKGEIWESTQTAYIPPRIWVYQLKRLNELLDDFLAHKDYLSRAFSYLSETYLTNASNPRIPDAYHSPFYQPELHRSRRITYAGGFKSFLREYQLEALFNKWIGEHKLTSVKYFSFFFSMVSDAAILYILNFSLQRNAEAMSLQSDCYKTEYDEKLGEVAYIAGETTKTIDDSDARWVVPTTIKKAIDVASWIAFERSKLIQGGLINPISPVSLAIRPTEPWSATSIEIRSPEIRVKANLRYQGFISSYPKVFDSDEIRITEDDWKIAVSMTPTINDHPSFQIGAPWPFAVHQLRRTTTVNMFSSAIVSDNSLQFQLKHLSRNMTLFYGRNYTNLRLNSDAATEVILESYRSVYRKLIEVVNDSETNVRPHKKELIPRQVVKLIDEREEMQLIKLIKKGVIGCRSTLLGYCMTSGSCVYGGLESISKCAVGDGNGICKDAIFSRNNEQKLRGLKSANEEQLAKLDQNSPRVNALKKENYAIGVYLEVIHR